MQFCWWDIDIGRLSITNRYTGQMLAYRGEVPEDERLGIVSTPNLRWMRLEYSDRHLRYPLFVQRRAVPDQHGHRYLIWRVDHLRSARAWAREGRSSRIQPAYGIWLRVDECVQDALSCWPKSRQTGARPDTIALEGGWFNGAWTRNFYRSRRALREETLESQRDPVMRPWLPPLDLPVPAPWRLVEASGSGKGGSLHGLGPEVLKCEAAEIDRAHLAREDGSARLIPIAAHPDYSHRQEFDWKKFCLRLLYVDDELVWDMAVADHRFSNTASPSVIEWQIAQVDRNVHRDNTYALPWREETEAGRYIADKSTRAVLEWELADERQRRQLGTFLSEAMLAWEPRALWLPESDRDELRELTIPAASQVGFYGTVIAGIPGEGDHRQTAAALPPNSYGRPHPMRYMFEEDDGVLRVSQRTEHLGWWDYDPEASGLVNRYSQQRLSFSGRFTSHRDIAACEPGEPQWFRFDYSDPGVRFPILARRDSRGLDGPLSGPWEVDYKRSCLLWARETGEPGEYPGYGLWRRVHDCTLDALLCWPELDATGEIAAAAYFASGWANGAWRPLLHIRAECDHMKRRETWGSERWNIAHYGGDELPVLEPLDSPAPSAWQFFDAPVAERGASLIGLATDLRSRRLTLPADAALKGFERQVPFMRRADGRAVFFPYGIHSSLFRGEDYKVEPETLYADESVLVWLRERWGEAGLMYGIRGAGSRDAAQAEELWRVVEGDANTLPLTYPSLRLYRRLQPSLVDAWLGWRGCDKRMLDDPAYIDKINQRDWFKTDYQNSGFVLERPHQIRLSGHYLAGLFFNRATFYLQLPDVPPDPVKELKERMATARLQEAADRLALAARQTPPRRR